MKKGLSLVLSSTLILGMIQSGVAAGVATPKEPTSETRGAYCHMVVYPKEHEMGKFSAQMVTAEGKTLFFDDIGCLFNYKRSLSEEPVSMWVRDYNTLEWIELDQATVVSADIETPMHYGFAFFKSKSSALKYMESNPSLKPVLVEWNLVDQLAQKREEMKKNGHSHMNHDSMDHDSMHSAGKSQGMIRVMINGEKQMFNQAPMVMNGRTLVPLRGILEKLGATVEWQPHTKKVKVVKGTKTIVLTINSKTALVNQKPVIMDTEAKIHNSVTMVPLRFIGEALGAKVSWDPKTKTVMIQSH